MRRKAFTEDDLFFWEGKLENRRECIVCINYRVFVVFLTIVFRSLYCQLGRAFKA